MILKINQKRTWGSW